MRVIVPFIVAFILGLLLTPLVRAGARSLGIIAQPTGDRWHEKPTALMGGVAIYAAFILGVVALFAYDHVGPARATLAQPKVIGIILGATLMFLTGVIDDRFGMRPASKLVFQGLAAAIVVSFGVVYPISPWMPVNVVATILWFIALTNALNLLDNMDGVAAGISAIAALFLAATFGWERQWVLAGVCAAMAGASIGFLRYNWHPASIFMGDSGSLFIGALLAGLGASYPSTASRSIVPILFIPAVIVAIPILDTALVTLTRTLAGRQLSVGGRDHTTHRLVAMGWSQKQAALLLHALAVSGGGVALIAWRSEAAFGLWTIAIFGVILVVLGVYLARLHTYVPDAQPAQPRVTILVSNLLYKRRALEVVLDITLFAVAYYAAYLLRWDGVIPAAQQTILENTLAVAVASQSVAFGLLGVYRGVWQQMTIVDAHRIVKASLLGTVLTVVVIVFAFRDASFARGIFVIQGMLVALLAIAARSSVRSLESVRASLRPAGTRTLIYGSGKAGELLFREIVSDAQLNLRPVGFIDDVGYHTGRLIHGLPVFAGLSQLTEIVERYRVQKIVVASREISKAQRDQLADLCAELHLSLQERDVTLREVSRSEMPPAFQPKNLASGA